MNTYCYELFLDWSSSNRDARAEPATALPAQFWQSRSRQHDRVGFHARPARVGHDTFNVVRVHAELRQPREPQPVGPFRQPINQPLLRGLVLQRQMRLSMCPDLTRTCTRVTCTAWRRINARRDAGGQRRPCAARRPVRPDCRRNCAPGRRGNRNRGRPPDRSPTGR